MFILYIEEYIWEVYYLVCLLHLLGGVFDCMNLYRNNL